jgi:hypothetical protein
MQPFRKTVHRARCRANRPRPMCRLRVEVLEDRFLPDGSPYGPSPVVARLLIDPNRVSIGDGDNWPVTWGDDNAVYTFFQDGAGFGTDSHSMAPARITGDPPDITGQNLFSPSGTMEGGGALGRKVSGLLMVNRSPDGAATPTLYAWVRNLHPNADGSDATGASLIWSDDHGATWNWEPEWSFADQLGYPVWLNAGQDYGAAPDPAHAYFYSPDGPSAYQTYADLLLGRVATARMTDPSAYEFFAGLDQNGNPQWGDFAHHVPVFHNPAGTFRPGAVYDPFLHRCLLAATDNFDAAQNYLGIFDAPNLWGPWTTVTYQDGWGGDPEHRFAPQIPSKWLSPDGLSFYLEYSALGGPYQFNLQEVSLRLVPLLGAGVAPPPAGMGVGGGLLNPPPAWVFTGAAGLAEDGRDSPAGSPRASAGIQNSVGGDTGGFPPGVSSVAGAGSQSFRAPQTSRRAEAQASDTAIAGDDLGTFTFDHQGGADQLFSGSVPAAAWFDPR